MCKCSFLLKLVSIDEKLTFCTKKRPVPSIYQQEKSSKVCKEKHTKNLVVGTYRESFRGLRKKWVWQIQSPTVASDWALGWRRWSWTAGGGRRDASVGGVAATEPRTSPARYISDSDYRSCRGRAQALATCPNPPPPPCHPHPKSAPYPRENDGQNPK